MAPTLRVALVGCGPISERHVLSWKSIPEVELVAVCDRHPDNFAPLVARYGVKAAYVDFGTLLAQVDCDVVDIATRPYSHKELVLQAARAGKHILCQKPFAPTLEQGLEMIQACDAHGVRLMVCENWRWHVWYQRIKELLDGGRIGDVRYFRMRFHNWFTIDRGALAALILRDSQRYLKDMDRLIVYEIGIHLVDVARFLFGDARSVYARLGRMSPHISGEDFALLVLDFGPMHGSIEASWCSREPRERGKAETVAIEGTAGSVFLDPTGRLQIVNVRGDVDVPQYDWEGETKLNSHFRLHRHFVDCLLANTPFQTDARDNIKTLEIALKAYDSAAANRVMELQTDRLLSVRNAAQ
jgi:predicted dehydrogenase